jgi:hypothetical protein
MLFKNSVRTSKRTLHFTITNINWLTPFKDIIAILKGSDDGVIHFEESCSRDFNHRPKFFFKNNVSENWFSGPVIETN